MKRIGVVLFTTFLACSVSVVAQQAASDGHLPRAGERTAEQQNAEKKAAAPAAEKPAPAPVAKPEPPKVAAKPAAVQPVKKAVTPTASVKPAEPKLIDGIPEGAVQIEQYAYTYTDSEGKEWLYRRTPFGVSRIAREPHAAADPSGLAGVGTAASHMPDITVTEKGDELQFEQPSPFGPRKWTKKKTELTSDEQAAWDRLKKKD